VGHRDLVQPKDVFHQHRLQNYTPSAVPLVGAVPGRASAGSHPETRRVEVTSGLLSRNIETGHG